MAKKLLSLLCAVALLVSMVTIVATVAATAEGTTINFLSSANASKWTTAWGFESYGGPFAGVVDLTGIDGWSFKEADDIQALMGVSVVNGGANRDGTQYGEFTYGETVDLGNEFSVLTTMYMTNTLWSTATPAVDDVVELRLGKYALRMIHTAADAAGRARTNTGTTARSCSRTAPSSAAPAFSLPPSWPNLPARRSMSAMAPN